MKHGSFKDVFHGAIRILTVVSLTAVVARGARAQTDAPPWGVASSAGSSRTLADWCGKVSAAGVSTIRMFPEWREIEPAEGTWRWDRADAIVNIAAANKVEINGILMGSAGWDRAKAHAFPMWHQEEWSTYVR